MKHLIRISLSVLILCAITLSGCKKNMSMNYVIQNEPHFSGITESVTDDWLIVKINEDDPLHDSYDTLQVSLNVQSKDGTYDYAEDDEIVVYYDGTITENRVETVYAITLLTPAWQRKQTSCL